MKSLRFLFLLLIYVSYSYTTNHRPITFIINNNTDKTLELILEYKIDQYYQHPTKVETPFTPYYMQVHYIPTIQPGKQVTIADSMRNCLPSFCSLDGSLKKYGFVHAYKMINANVAVQDYNYSFDFKEAVTDNNAITINLHPYKKATLLVTS
jgi:hypothetical protein